ncbi:MAG: helix-hairpin-helix domain-containing protein [Candidatus Bathyarchaeota archaeon]|nr:helix-hairpin-helix domain-containing protein [Candidatus Bathyarchaeota archaeon]
MRSDYALYTVAIIFFILTGIVLAYQIELKELWVVTTAILGLLFIGLGYTQKPKPQAIRVEAPPQVPAPEMPTPSPVTEVMKEEKVETVVEVAPQKMKLTKVKGIGEKRAEQLKALGISSVEDLAKASAEDLAEKLKISPKITGRWIENAKKLLEKS